VSFLKPLRKGFLVTLKHTLNPLTRRLARASVGPFSIVRHTGRRSGRQYETPIIVSPVEGGFVIELTYGPEVDWYKNIVAAGGCTVVWRGREYVIDELAALDTETGLAAFPPSQRLALRALGRKHFRKLIYQHSYSKGNQGYPDNPLE
jgi:deazaflavin-dependent oxidoreductase (nitroreductase family)